MFRQIKIICFEKKKFMLPSDVLTTFLNSKNDNEKKEILEEFAHNLPNVTRTRDQCKFIKLPLHFQFCSLKFKTNANNHFHFQIKF